MPSIQKITKLMVSSQNNRKPSHNLSQRWHPPVLWRHTDKGNGVLGTPVLSTTPPPFSFFLSTAPFKKHTLHQHPFLGCPKMKVTIKFHLICSPQLRDMQHFWVLSMNTRLQSIGPHWKKNHQGTRGFGVPAPRTPRTKARGAAGRQRRGVGADKSGSGNLLKDSAVRGAGGPSEELRRGREGRLRAGRVPQAGTAPREGSARGLAKKKNQKHTHTGLRFPTHPPPATQDAKRVGARIPTRRGGVRGGSGGGRSPPTR